MTEHEWQKYYQLVPEAGELIIYDPDEKYSYARIKVGDGTHTLKELNFFIDTTIAETLKQVRFEDTIDGGRITEYKNN